MNIKLYIDKEFFIFNDSELITKDMLLDLDNLNKVAKNDGDTILKLEDLYDVEVLDNIKLYEIMYMGKGNITTETRKFLIKLIDKFSTDDKVNLSEVRNNEKIYRAGFICLNKPSICNIYNVFNEEDLYELRVEYLKEIKTENEFMLEVKGCYKNLYFHDDIENTLKTLSSPIKDYVEIIASHLSAINNKFLDIYKDNENSGLVEILSHFQSATGIKCTLEGNRKSTKSRLTFTFKDIKGNNINLVCEPHTKLDGNDKSGDTKFRFDRIYFHKGDNRIAENKVIIAHIGNHL
ncbi:MAG: hypothetical protein ACRCXT_12810 [Paraclostridium sp.]